MTSNPEVLFLDALQAVYGPLDWLPEPDGQLHRFHVPGDRAGSRNGWYVLFPDGLAAGAFGSWKTGEAHHWSSRTPADPQEAEQVRWRIEQARRQREAEQQQRQQAAALEARSRWSRAVPASPDHPYLVAKGVEPNGLRQAGDVLLVPLYAAGELVNLQRIHPDGAKRFLYGGRVKGACSPIGRLEPGRTLYLCEGWATGATIHEETGFPVACALNADNLLAVGQELRRRHLAHGCHGRVYGLGYISGRPQAARSLIQALGGAGQARILALALGSIAITFSTAQEAPIAPALGRGHLAHPRRHPGSWWRAGGGRPRRESWSGHRNRCGRHRNINGCRVAAAGRHRDGRRARWGWSSRRRGL